jgi:hypothetical protein
MKMISAAIRAEQARRDTLDLIKSLPAGKPFHGRERLFGDLAAARTLAAHRGAARPRDVCYYMMMISAEFRALELPPHSAIRRVRAMLRTLSAAEAERRAESLAEAFADLDRLLD